MLQIPIKLHNLLRKNKKIYWTEKGQKVFDEIKEKMCTQPLLTIFGLDRPIGVRLLAIGAVLQQSQEDGIEKT